MQPLPPPESVSTHPKLQLSELRALYGLTRTVSGASSVEAIYECAMDAIAQVLGAERLALLLFDDDSVMRFAAWRGLSGEYRRAVEGHSPWPPDAADPAPVLVEDVEVDEELAVYRPLFAREGIGAIGFFPLSLQGRLLGKFMVYYPSAHRFGRDEVSLAQTVAHHIALGVSRIRQREQLRRSKEQLEVVLSGVADGITAHDPSGRLLYANRAAARLCAFDSPEELVAAEPSSITERFEILDEEGAPLPFSQLPGRRAAASGRPAESLVRFRARATGEERVAQVRAAPILTADGDVALSVNIFRDVTDERRQHAEREALLQRERAARDEAEAARARLQLLADASLVMASSSLDGRAMLRPLARLLSHNVGDVCLIRTASADAEHLELAAFASREPKVLEWMERELVGRPPRPSGEGAVGLVFETGEALLVPEVDEELVRRLAPPRDADEILRLGLRSLIVAPLRARGETLGTLSVARTGGAFEEADLSLVREIASRAGLTLVAGEIHESEKRSRAAAELERQRRDELLAVVSHDLRTPLTVITTSADVLRALAGGSPLADRSLAAIARSAASMKRLIQDLLDLDALDHGALQVRREDELLAPILEHALGLLRPLADDRRLELCLEVDDDSLRVCCDRDRLVQVLTNVVGNAIKFSAAGGRVRIRLQSRDGAARVEVVDDGPGIRAEDRELVFERYYRGERRQRQGAGLGLAIAKALVEAQGGQIGLESEPGAGATFWFELPLR